MKEDDGFVKYAVSLITKESPFLNSKGAVNLGQSCPIATTDQEAEDNKFVANLVFEMPPQTAIEDGNIPRLVSKKLFINMLNFSYKCVPFHVSKFSR